MRSPRPLTKGSSVTAVRGERSCPIDHSGIHSRGSRGGPGSHHLALAVTTTRPCVWLRLGAYGVTFVPRPSTDVCRSGSVCKGEGEGEGGARAVSRRVGPLWVHRITLAPERQSVATARRFVREHLTVHDLALLVDDVTLVASELATNALRHAGTAFTVTITAFPDDVVLAVEDGSISMPVLVDAGVDEVVGRGMAIVDVVSSDWGVVVDADVGKSVWATFDVG